MGKETLLLPTVKIMVIKKLKQLKQARVNVWSGAKVREK